MVLDKTMLETDIFLDYSSLLILKKRENRHEITDAGERTYRSQAGVECSMD